MAIKKSELYSSLWASCDELRGGMDASQYKDYVLSLLFIKYVSDKYAGVPFSPITIPPGASFADMVALKGNPEIGDKINKQIIAPLADANQQLSQADFPDFNDATKLGDGKERQDKLTNLIAIFEDKALDFSKNRADGDDILGDAYEYLMRHFATESGKSKGQFYTPAEVSRVMAQYGAPRGVKPNSGKSRQTKKKKIANATVNRELACPKKMYSNLVADGVLASNPVKLVKFLQEDNEPGRVLDREEERLYLLAASQPLQDYATVLVETGMRPEELCKLAVRDVYPNVEKPYLIVKAGKTKSATRTIPLSGRAARVLEKRVTAAKGKYIFAGGRGGTDPDRPARKFNNAHYGTLKRSKIDGENRSGTEGVCTLYSFRHTFATRFLERRPGDLLTLAALLGHSSLRMVMRYAHPSDEHKFDAIRSMEELHSGGNSQNAG